MREWGSEGILPSEDAVAAMKAVYQGRFLDMETETLEEAHKAVRSKLDNPNKTLYYLNGVLMTSADRTGRILFPTQSQGTNIINAPGASFITSGKEHPGWEEKEE